MIRSLVLSLLLVLMVAPAQEPWIRCDDRSAVAWRWQVAEAGGLVVGEPIEAGSEVVEILVLAGKRSSSYDQALGRLCRDFLQAGVAVRWVCRTFDRDAARAQALLAPLRIGGVAHPDLLVSMGTEALQALHADPRPLQVPAVTCTCKSPSRLGYAPADGSPAGGMIAYTTLNVPPALQLRYLRQTMPDLGELLICVNRRRELVMRAEVAPLQEACAAAGITATLIAVDGAVAVAPQLRRQAGAHLAGASPRESGTTAWWVTSCTVLFDQVGVLQEIADLPVFSENPGLVRSREEAGASALAGIGIDRRTNAHLAAHYALRILRGSTTAGALPLGVADPPDIAVNVARCRHHGLGVPFGLLEAASAIVDASGQRLLRQPGRAP